jgi:hypothetical protein
LKFTGDGDGYQIFISGLKNQLTMKNNLIAMLPDNPREGFKFQAWKGEDLGSEESEAFLNRSG